MPVLNYILPILQTGTILAFDDYFCFNGDPERGGQLALKEFLNRNPQIKIADYLNIGWGGKSFIVKTYSTQAEAKYVSPTKSCVFQLSLTVMLPLGGL